jgi:hypothetical protein
VKPDEHYVVEEQHDGGELIRDSWDAGEELSGDVADVFGLGVLHHELPEDIARV